MLYNTYFLYFIIYSFLGWVYESTLCSLLEYNRIINRGFLIGPYCPIYGVGIIINWILFGELKDPFIIFIAAGFISCAIEYVVSYIMEKLFNAKWWDYSHFPFNLNGRICLYGGLVFGAGSTVFIKCIHPVIMFGIDKIPNTYINWSTLVLGSLFITDIILTVNSINSLNKKLKTFHDVLNQKVENTLDILSDRINVLEESLNFEKGKGIMIKIHDMNSQIKEKELRLIKAFPHIRFIKYGSIGANICKKIEDETKRKNKCPEQDPDELEKVGTVIK